MFFLQNETAGYVGNSPLWWRDGGSGYTDNLNEAQKFTEKEADDIIRSTRGSHQWCKWLVEDVLAVANIRTTVNMDDLRNCWRNVENGKIRETVERKTETNSFDS